MISVEIVYALRAVQHVLSLELQPGSTVEDALALAQLDLLFSSFPLADAPVGIWGEVVARDRLLADGDRVEIYRPLLVDPMEARRRRASS